MSGLVKAKKYDWKDSNLALFGSDTEKNVSYEVLTLKLRLCGHAFNQVKKESAATEPAWRGAGQKVGKKIWRIVKFKVSWHMPSLHSNIGA